MAETMPDDSSGPPVERLAQSLLACAREQPSLLVRPPAADDRALPSLVEELPRSHGRPALLAPSRLNRPSERSPYLEELVSIAVSTAHQAEDAARRASDACALARRDRLAWAGFGVLGIVIGVAGAVDAHWVQGMGRQPVETVSALRFPDSAQGKAGGMPGSAVASETPVSPALQPTTVEPSPRASSAETFEPPLPPAIPIAVRPTWSIDSAGVPPSYDVIPYYPPPRPKYHAQRNRRINVTRRHPVVLARFFASLRRDVRSIFQ
jgi:hypothetical protein